MKRDPKGNVLKTKVSQKKSWRKVLLENQKKFTERLSEHDRKMKEIIKEEIERRLDDKIHMIESTLKDVMVQRKIFEDKGYITKKEINKKYDELKGRENG